jgi:hypothetical protein
MYDRTIVPVSDPGPPEQEQDMENVTTYTQVRTDRMRINAAFKTWKIELQPGNEDAVMYSTVTVRGWQEVEIRYDGETMVAALLTARYADRRSFTDVDSLLAAAGVPRHGQANPERTDPATTYVCILKDHITGATLHVELRDTPPEWDTTDTTDGVWEIRTGHVNGGTTTAVRA